LKDELGMSKAEDRMADTKEGPVIVWFRNDLRLSDNPALGAAAQTGRPVIAVYIFEETEDLRPMGGAARWWLDKSLKALMNDLAGLGARLVLRRGDPRVIMAALTEETQAAAVFWNRRYAPDAIAVDREIKEGLVARGIEAKSFNGALLAEPWEIKNQSGGAFKVFTPFWRALVAAYRASPETPRPERLVAPAAQPASLDLAELRLHPTAPDWSTGFADWRPGEAGAKARLDDFLENAVSHYADGRDIPGKAWTSRLSPHLAFGEIGPRQIWRAVERERHVRGEARGLDKFLSEVGWREFSYGLLYQFPELETRAFKAPYDAFPWRDDEAGYRAWTRGLTGYPMVDAGMRELWTTGYMHNRVRMLVASFLVKHLLIDWRRGEAWFFDTLLDADRANNAASWQWVAGSGADAAPYFRIFSPMGQGEKFDADGAYVRRWVPEIARLPDAFLHAPWDAPPSVLAAAGIRLGDTYPRPIVDHAMARARALDALKTLPSA
jgi:deoxyribodipyrimidine photo-lyase